MTDKQPSARERAKLMTEIEYFKDEKGKHGWSILLYQDRDRDRILMADECTDKNNALDVLEKVRATIEKEILAAQAEARGEGLEQGAKIVESHELVQGRPLFGIPAAIRKAKEGK